MLLGQDIHKYNGETNPGIAKDAGSHFVLIRAGGVAYDGSYFTDPQLERNADIWPAYGFPVGFWWVFRPNYDPRAQADHFINLIKDYHQDIPAEMDCELYGGVSATTYSANLLLALGQLDAAWPNVRHIVYTRSSFFNRAAARRQEYKEKYDLWIARYTIKPQPWGNPGDLSYLVPLDWDTWIFWQYSADGNGLGPAFGGEAPPNGDHDMDLDRFNGSQAEFNQYFNIGQEAKPTIIEVVASKNTTLRSEPKGAHEAAIPVGTRLGVIDVEVAADGSTWFNVGGTWILEDHVKVIA